MKKTLSSLLLPVLLLTAGCSKFENVFTTGDPPLTGERISILQLQKELTPAPEAQQTPITLPDAWTNKFWPQAGGYPNHVLGQVTLGENLKEVWTSDIGAGGDRRDPLISPPIVADGLVFTLDTDGEIAAFDLAKGDRKWRVSSIMKDEENTGGLGGGVAYASGKLYVTNGYKQLECFNAATGALLWRVPLPAPARATPTVTDDKIYLITLDNRLMVFQASDGTAVWNYAGIAETTNILGSVSPAVDASIVVLPQSSGEIFGLRAENGQMVWQDNLSTVSHTTTLSSISDIRGQPVIDQNLVFASSYSGRMVALDAVSGQRVWQKDIGSAEMPWVAGDTVYVVSTEQQLIALARQTGDIRWVTQLPRYDGDSKDKPIVWTGPVLAGGRLLLASNHEELVEVSPLDGKILKTTELPGSVTIAPIVADNTLLILTGSGKLAAYR